MASQWFYKQAGEKCGPVNTDQLKSLATSMQILPDALIWKEGMTEWVSASRLKVLFKTQAGAEATATRPSAVSQAASTETGQSGGPAAVITPEQTFGGRMRAAGQLAAKQAIRTRLTSITLPNAFKALGRHLENSEQFKSEFPHLFDQYITLQEQMSSLRHTAAARPSTEGFKAKAIAAAIIVKEAAQYKGLELRIGHLLGKVGEEAFAKRGGGCGPADITKPIVDLKSQISSLDEEISRLSTAKPGQIATTRRIAFGGVILISVGLLFAIHHFTSSSGAQTVQLPMKRKSGTPSDHIIPQSQEISLTSSQATIINSDTHGGKNPKEETSELSYELDPTTAYQQMNGLAVLLESAPKVLDFSVIARVDDNLFEVAWLDAEGNSIGGAHDLVQTVFTQFESNGRARMPLESIGTRSVHLKNGFDKEVEVFREAMSDAGVRARDATEVGEQRGVILKRLFLARQILIASLLRSKLNLTSNQVMQDETSRLLPLEYPEPRIGALGLKGKYPIFTIDSILASYLNKAKHGMSILDFAESTGDEKLVAAVKALHDDK